MKKVKLNDIIKNKDKDFYIIAETAFSHDGDIEYLRKQIEHANKGDVDAIKFQILLDYNDAFSSKLDNFEKIHKWCYSEEEWIELIQIARSKNLEIIILPIDRDSLKFIQKNLDFIDAIEIHSICFNEVPLIQEIKKVPKTIMLGIGGRTLKDIDFTLNLLLNNSTKSEKEVIMMLGFQNYPTDIEKLNLSKFKYLKKKYQSILGYADHTDYRDYKIGNDLIKYAFLLDAKIFEKHLVLKKGEKRVDYEAAISYIEFKELRKELESLKKILGNEELRNLNESELTYKNREKQIVAKIDLEKGTIITEKNIGYKISNDKSDFEQKEYQLILNNKLKKAINKDDVLRRDHIDL